MASQLLYSYADIDTIQPRTDKDRALLALAVRHGFYTPMESVGPDAYGFNRVKFGELRTFAAELLWHAKDQPADGVPACLSPDGEPRRCVLWKCHEAKACARGVGASDDATLHAEYTREDLGEGVRGKHKQMDWGAVDYELLQIMGDLECKQSTMNKTLNELRRLLRKVSGQ